MMTDLERLIEWYRIEITQLEAQIVEVKHKHDVLVEASRLLEEAFEEEARTPDRNWHRNLYLRLSGGRREKA